MQPKIKFRELKTHIYFCKKVLGVNKRYPNTACRNELGRLPLKELTNLNVIKFWILLENQPKDSYCQKLTNINRYGRQKPDAKSCAKS